MRVGSRWKSVVCDTEVIVVRSGSKALQLNCGGRPMVESRAVPPTGEIDPRFADGTQLGKRYEDTADAAEVLCTKAGAGSLSIGERRLVLKDAKPLPSSD